MDLWSSLRSFQPLGGCGFSWIHGVLVQKKPQESGLENRSVNKTCNAQSSKNNCLLHFDQYAVFKTNQLLIQSGSLVLCITLKMAFLLHDLLPVNVLKHDSGIANHLENSDHTYYSN